MKERKPIHDNWKTPQWLLSYVERFYMCEDPYFDPCPLNSDFDGLLIEWKDKNYINPPYNRKVKEAFIRKSFEESKKGKLCVMLLPVSTSTKIFHEIIKPNCEIHFLKGRVKFEGINTKGQLVNNKCGMHDSMICIFKANNG